MPFSVQTLKTRPEFLSCAKGLRKKCPYFMIQARDRKDGDTRIGVGFTCSKKVGNAVARNRAKRRLRAIASEVLPSSGQKGWDYVLIGFAHATQAAPFDQMRDSLKKMLRDMHED